MYLTSDPQNMNGHNYLRGKYNLPMPNMIKYGRAQGAISTSELDKLGIGQRKAKKVAQPKRILPKYFRDDPFADPPPITQDDIEDGMFNLLNRGIIPRDVDLTPAFERGSAPLKMAKMQLGEKPKEPRMQAVQAPLAIKPPPKQRGEEPPSTTFLTQLGGPQLQGGPTT